MQKILKKNLLGTGYKHPFIGYYMPLYSELQSIQIIVEVPITSLKWTRKYQSVAVPTMLKIVS